MPQDSEQPPEEVFDDIFLRNQGLNIFGDPVEMFSTREHTEGCIRRDKNGKPYMSIRTINVLQEDSPEDPEDYYPMIDEYDGYDDFEDEDVDEIEDLLDEIEKQQQYQQSQEL